MSLYLVTGGAGFIGSHIVETLVQRGDRVRVLDNFSTGRKENLAAVLDRIELMTADIRRLDEVRACMQGVDYVLHQAAMVSVPQSMADPTATHEVNVTGTLNVLIASREASVKRFVMASSCAIYGDNDQLPLSEASSPRPMSPYAASKLIDEAYCQTFHAAYGLSTGCLRYFNVYGARQDPNGDYAAVVPKFIARMEAGKPPIIFGDGTQTRDFVHVSDIVRMNLALCEHTEIAGQVFNVASGKRTSLLELVSALNGLLNADFAPEFRPARKGDILHSVGSGDRLAATIGLRAQTSLVEGLRQVLSKGALTPA